MQEMIYFCMGYSNHVTAAKKRTAKTVLFFGASDVTRTRDLLITSAVFDVLRGFAILRNLLRCNGFCYSVVLYRLATGGNISQLW